MVNPETLLEHGTLWEKENMRRIYLKTSAVCTAYGLSCIFYPGGRVRSATLNGSPITNSRATRIIAMVQHSKLYYNLDTEKFESKTMPKTILNRVKRYWIQHG